MLIYLLAPYKRVGDDSVHLQAQSVLILIASLGYILRNDVETNSWTFMLATVTAMIVICGVFIHWLVQLWRLTRKGLRIKSATKAPEWRASLTKENGANGRSFDGSGGGSVKGEGTVGTVRDDEDNDDYGASSSSSEDDDDDVVNGNHITAYRSAKNKASVPTPASAPNATNTVATVGFQQSSDRNGARGSLSPSSRRTATVSFAPDS